MNCKCFTLTAICFPSSIVRNGVLCAGFILCPLLMGCEDDRPADLPRCVTSVVGLAEAERVEEGPSSMSGQAFKWYEFFGETTLSDRDSLVLRFAIIPFLDEHGKPTEVSLQTLDGPTWLNLRFNNGTVNGLVRYAREDWNCVEMRISLSTESYHIVVNGAHAGPIPIDVHSTGVQAITVAYAASRSDTTYTKTAWLDSISLEKIHNGQATSLFTQDFDSGQVMDFHAGRIVSVWPPR